MIISLAQKNKHLRKIVYSIGRKRAESMIKNFEHFIEDHHRVLDIGAGTCNVSEVLIEKGVNIQPLDVVNLSFVKEIEPEIYDGSKIPYSEKDFHVSLLLTVLHHIQDPDAVLKEAVKVSERIVVIEDIYKNNIEKYLTFFFDSLFNLEFFGHPHTNKTDEEWREIFEELGLEIVEYKEHRSFVVMKQGVYLLKRKDI